jgi:hypothetical protein
MSLCTTCKYFKPDTSWNGLENRLKYGLCRHPKSATVHLVSGVIYYEEAVQMRYYNGPCGKTGRLYEEEKNQFILKTRTISPNDVTCFCILCMTIYLLLIVVRGHV